MPDPFIGEIIMFGGNFAPRGWALCEGQILSISQNQALFSILGTTFGGDGRTNFALPDLRGRVPLGPGTGPGLTNRRLGEQGGEERVTLNANQIPAHSHAVNCSKQRAEQMNPENNFIAQPNIQENAFNNSHDAQMNAAMIADTGGGQSHDNMQPFLGINFIIALVGVYPSRN